MAITVQIPTALRRHTAGVGSIACAATNLGELFSVLDEKFPELKPHLRDEAGQVRRFLNIYVNEEDIRFLGGPGYVFRMGTKCCWCLRSRAEHSNSQGSSSQTLICLQIELHCV